jgi:rhodanese-related sulfurtransferase
LSYAGDITPTEAFEWLREVPGATLVDVRSQVELAFVGLPDLGVIGKDVIRVEWQQFPDGTVNDQFVEDLASAGLDQADPVLFLCRSGARSATAAGVASRAGYRQAYNVAEGFEGPLDVSGHRGTTGGWKAAGLPWRQS